MNIYLLRHGETDWNREGRIQGHTDVSLNQNGRMQVSETVQSLAKVCTDIDLILSSPLSRAWESAKIAAERLSYPEERIVVEPLLIERGFGEMEGMAAAEREDRFPNYHYADSDYRIPGMESYEELIGRSQDLIHKIVTVYQDKQNILAASHGAILNAVITSVTGGKISYFSDTVQIDSGSIHRIRYTDRAVGLARYSPEKSGFIDIVF